MALGLIDTHELTDNISMSEINDGHNHKVVLAKLAY